MEGNGTQNSPYLLTSIEDWNTFFNDIYSQNSSSTAATVYAQLNNDLDFADTPYSIYTGNKYNLNFDGQNHSIKNINLNTVNTVYLFPYVNANSTIKNIIFESSVISANDLFGIYVTSGSNIDNVIFKGCYFNTGGANIIYNLQGTTSNSASNCKIHCNSYYGIYSLTINYCMLFDDITHNEGGSNSSADGLSGASSILCSFSRNKYNGFNSVYDIGNSTDRIVRQCYSASSYEDCTIANIHPLIGNSSNRYENFFDSTLFPEYTSTSYVTPLTTAQLKDKSYLMSKGWVF